MEAIGVILLAAGLPVPLFSTEVTNDSNSFKFLGPDVSVGRANRAPLIISCFVALSGIVIYKLKN